MTFSFNYGNLSEKIINKKLTQCIVLEHLETLRFNFWSKKFKIRSHDPLKST